MLLILLLILFCQKIRHSKTMTRKRFTAEEPAELLMVDDCPDRANLDFSTDNNNSSSADLDQAALSDSGSMQHWLVNLAVSQIQRGRRKLKFLLTIMYCFRGY